MGGPPAAEETRVAAAENGNCESLVFVILFRNRTWDQLMYICICRSLTDRDIRRGVFGGEVACMQSLRDRLGASAGCGRCEAVARDCLNEALAEKRSMEEAGEDRSRWEGEDIHPDPAFGQATA